LEESAGDGVGEEMVESAGDGGGSPLEEDAGDGGGEPMEESAGEDVRDVSMWRRGNLKGFGATADGPGRGGHDGPEVGEDYDGPRGT
jgi:hypothetical protein